LQLTPPHGLTLISPGLREAVGHLQPRPSLLAAERLVEPDRYVGRNTALAIDQIVEGLACNAENVGGVGDGQAERLNAVVADGQAGIRRVFIVTMVPAVRWW
jgi:hypothetical protein